MKRWRAIGRVVRAVAHVVRGLWTIRTQFGRLTHAQSQLLVREWSRRMLAIMGIELVVHGEVPSLFAGAGALVILAATVTHSLAASRARSAS